MIIGITHLTLVYNTSNVMQGSIQASSAYAASTLTNHGLSSKWQIRLCQANIQ